MFSVSTITTPCLRFYVLISKVHEFVIYFRIVFFMFHFKV
jgi:hypothetical protein